MRTETLDKRVRAFVGDTAVVDSRAPMLFFEDRFPVPGYAFADHDVRTDLLRPTDDPPPEKPFFYLPKGPVAQLVRPPRQRTGRSARRLATRRPGDRRQSSSSAGSPVSSTAGWRRKRLSSSIRASRTAREALAKPRGTWEISLDGVVLADSRRPVLLFETTPADALLRSAV